MECNKINITDNTINSTTDNTTYNITQPVSPSGNKVNNLVWIDMEMSGLNCDENVILEVALVITDNNLNVLAQLPSYAIWQSEEVLNGMDEWNRRVHKKSGLIERVRQSTYTIAQVEGEIIAFLKQYVVKQHSPLCGNTVHQDRKFIARYMPLLEDYLHYRNLDVSTMKELAKRWHPHIFKSFKKANKHEALADIHESIAELKHYRQSMLVGESINGMPDGVSNSMSDSGSDSKSTDVNSNDYRNKLLNGKLLAGTILEEIAKEVACIARTHRPPCLAVVLVGDDPASCVYVNNKKKACTKVGIESREFRLASDIAMNELLTVIEQLNNDDAVDGILVQMPLPAHLDSKAIIDALLPTKDVDGFHRYNMGSLAINDAATCPCTPHGVIALLDSVGFVYQGKHAVIIGASNIVGRPMALELINRRATVSICNSKTINLPTLSKMADLLIVAIGRPKFIQANWVKEGAIVIDVGINRLAEGGLCGDANFAELLPRVSYITPVPGGVGPMTIAMLLRNTLRCYHSHQH